MHFRSDRSAPVSPDDLSLVGPATDVVAAFQANTQDLVDQVARSGYRVREEDSVLVERIRQSRVRKWVPAIQACSALTALERRLFTALLANAFDDLLVRPVHQISISALTEVLNCRTRDLGYLKAAYERLMTLPLIDGEIDGSTPLKAMAGLDPSKRDWRGNLVGSRQFCNGVLSYSFDLPVALQYAKGTPYATVSVASALGLKTAGAMALYETCVRYIETGSTGVKDNRVWRELLCGATPAASAGATEGVSSPSYFDDFRRLNEKKIRPSLKEINSITEISLEIDLGPQPRTQGGKVSQFKFLVQRKPDALPEGDLSAYLRLTPVFKEAMGMEVGYDIALQLAAETQWGPLVLDRIRATKAKGVLTSARALATSFLQKRSEIKGVRPGVGKPVVSAAPAAPVSIKPQPSRSPPAAAVVVPPGVNARSLPKSHPLHAAYRLEAIREMVHALKGEEIADLEAAFVGENPKYGPVFRWVAPAGTQPRPPAVYAFEAWLFERRGLGSVEKLRAWLDRQAPVGANCKAGMS